MHKTNDEQQQSSIDFYNFIRGNNENEDISDTYNINGLNVYKKLVYIGVDNMVKSCYPELYKQLDDPSIQMLLLDFISSSKWSSPFYGSLQHEFEQYIKNTNL
jgi:hypothetical protein